MNALHAMLGNDATARYIARATVVAIHDDGGVEVSRDGGAIATCDLLCTGGSPLPLAAGDCVLVWSPARDEERGVVLGRIGPSVGLLPDAIPEEEMPAELVLEAAKSLTLRVGDGSITIREDGRILIKGKDLVSHAQRVNRIKGGSVSIN
jgi:hypothetical protein